MFLCLSLHKHPPPPSCLLGSQQVLMLMEKYWDKCIMVLVLSAGLYNCSCLFFYSYIIVILWRCFSGWLFTPSKHGNSSIYSPQSVISVDWLVTVSGVRLLQSRIRVLKMIIYSEGEWAETENTALVLVLSQALRMVFWAYFQNTLEFYKPVEDRWTWFLQFLGLVHVMI